MPSSANAGAAGAGFGPNVRWHGLLKGSGVCVLFGVEGAGWSSNMKMWPTKMGGL